MSVTVIDDSGVALDPCTERRARILLERNRAVVVSRNPFTIRLIDVSGGAMSTQESGVAKTSVSEAFKNWAEAVGDPIESWNFDFFVGEKPLWLVNKVKSTDGKMAVRQVLSDSSGIYDLRNKIVRVTYYTDIPSILSEVEFSLGRISDVNLSCNASVAGECAEVEVVYECTFVSMTDGCKKVSE
jgi:hypothetical protein